MDRLEQWNRLFGIKGSLIFVEGPGGMPVVELHNDLGEAAISVQGAHVFGFRARGQQPLIWMSDAARFAPGKSLRGGVPVCWPWFGPHGSDASLPGHGPARTADWEPVASEMLKDGRSSISFELLQDERIRQMCPLPLSVQLNVVVGCGLSLTLETRNLGNTECTLSQALHTYLLVGDVRRAEVEGLDGCAYIDKMDDGARKQQDGALNLDGETDRIYLGSGGRLGIVDPVMGRRIVIESAGSASAVVWNPWDKTAAKMGDLGPHGWLRMLCVETANAADDAVRIAPGAMHRLSATFSSRPL